MGAMFTPVADRFAWYENDGNEDTSTELTENSPTTKDMSSDYQIHLRFRVQETADAAGAGTDDWAIQYQVNGGGGWTTVTTTSANCQVHTTSALDGTSVSERLDAGTGSYDTGASDETDGIQTDFALGALNRTNFVWALNMIAADWTSNGVSSLHFRCRVNGGAVSTTSTPIFNAIAFDADAEKFRFYNDGTETAASPIAAEDVNPTGRNVDSDSQIQLRWSVQELNGINGLTSDNYFLQKSLNGGAWTAIDDLSAQVQSDIGSALTDGDPTTNRSLPDGMTDGTGSFVAGEQESNPSTTISNYQLTASNFTEHVYALLLISADLSNGDFMEFRMQHSVLGLISSIIPRITVTKGAAAVPEPGFLAATYRRRRTVNDLITR